MPEDSCGPRLLALRDQRENLLARQAELQDALAATDMAAPDELALAGLRHRIRDGLAMEGTPAKKALLRSLVARVEVAGRNEITPWFRVPTSTNTNTLTSEGVRMLSSLVEVGGLEPPSRYVVSGLLRAQPPGVV